MGVQYAVSRAAIPKLLIITDNTKGIEPGIIIIKMMHLISVDDGDYTGRKEHHIQRFILKDHREASFLSCSANRAKTR